MSRKEKLHYLNTAIWFNLIIGVYNLYVFVQIQSIFHLILGSVNIGVWVFNKHRLSSIIKSFRVLYPKQK